MSKLTEYLVPDGLFLGQTAANANEVIGLLADHLEKTRTVRDSYGPAVLAREAIMPTGLPLNDSIAVAVPHTDPEHVLDSGIAVAILKRPVSFGSMDDPDKTLPVRIVFALALRSKDEQLEMLLAVGKLLQDAERLQKLAAANTVDEARALLAGT